MFAKTNTSSTQPVEGTTKRHITRPLPDEALKRFANWIQHESWEFVYDGANPSEMVDRFNNIVQVNLDIHCPTKTVQITNLDGKVSSVAVKQASRRKNREYLKNGNTPKYKLLKKEVESKMKEAAKNRQSHY